MAAATGYFAAVNRFHFGDDFSEKFADMLREVSTSELATELSLANRCLVVGPGSGQFDIELVRHLMPNLKKLTAVEPDKSSVSYLQKNLQQNLSNVAWKIVELPIEQLLEDVELNDQSFDAVLLFHVLYHVHIDDRRQLFAKLFNGLLRPNGLALVLMNSRCEMRESIYNLTKRLCENSPTLVSGTMIQTEMTQAGFGIVAKFEMQVRRDFSNVDQQLADLFTLIVDHPITVEEMHSAVYDVWPNGKTEDNFEMLTVLKSFHPASSTDDV